MNRLYIAFWLIFILFLQIVVFNNINFLGFINPYLYVSFVFLFPLNKNRFPVLILAFFYGLTLDFFSDTGAIHAFALTFVTYIRLFFVEVFFKKSSIDYPLFKLSLEPTGSIFNYVSILTIIHHLLIFLLANFSLRNLPDVILNTLYSSVFTLLLYFIGSFLFRNKQTL